MKKEITTSIDYEILEKIETYNDFYKYYLNETKKITGDKRTNEYKQAVVKFETYLYNEWRNARNAFLEKELENIQHTCTCDIASLKLIKEDDSFVLFRVGSDGDAKYAILKDENMIPSYYRCLPIALNGKYKILSYDCFKSFKDEGTIIESKYINIFRHYNEYIFLLGGDAQ